MYPTSTGGRKPGQNIQGTENTGKNMLRPSSCSGVTTADMMMIQIENSGERERESSKIILVSY